MSKVPFAFVAIAVALAPLAGCAGAGGDLGGSGSSPQVTGDENGGKIPNALGTRADQTAAYQMVTSHCEKFGKKGVIIKMDYDTGLITFDCRVTKKTTS
jgi:hypothetical protein